MHSTARPRILIVDDELFNVDLLEQELEDLGFDTISAYNGQEALEQVAAGSPDAILLDIMMPVMDGFQVLARLKGQEATRDIPVIVVSALNDLPSMVRGIELGALDYLPKPVETVMLRARLNTALLAKRLRDMELEYLEQVGRVLDAAIAVEASSFQPESLDEVAARQDTLGQLARVFQRMAHEVALREQRLKQLLRQARLDMEEMKKALSEPVSVYLPMDRRVALARGESLPEQAEGSALFADISGFTPLTALLVAELGMQAGAEELTRQLEQVYTALIDQVHHYGGSVIGFSGDAITCWLDGDDGSRAVACGLALQEAMGAFAGLQTSTGTPVSLAIKVAAVQGPVRRFLVGDPDIQRVEVIAGQVLDRLAAAEGRARRGEVLIPADLAARLGDLLAISDWRESEEGGLRLAVLGGLVRPVPAQPWPEHLPVALDEAQCRPWLYPSVYERVRSSSKAFLAELRPVTALFLLFRGIDFENDPQAGARLDEFIRRVQAIILHYDGTLIQITIGDKGSYLSAAFGAPVAHPDDPLRAIRAGLELEQLPHQFGFIHSMQIGIAQGEMRTGAYGSSAQRTYGMMGDKVNLAARLMQAATEGMLCDENVYRSVRGTMEMSALPQIKVKGKDEWIAIYCPAGEKQSGSRRKMAIAGRAQEQSALQRGLDELLAGNGGVILLEGEAGLGKTRLLENLAEGAGARGLRVIHGAAQEGKVGSSLAAWRGIAGQALGLDSPPDPQARIEQIQALAGDEVDLPSLSLLNPFFGLAGSESIAVIQEDEPDPLRRTIELLAGLVAEAAKVSPLVILLDDAQDLDLASWELALALARRAAPVLLAVAARPLPMPLPEAYLNLFVLPAAQALTLAPLSQDDATLLACRRSGVDAIPEPLQELLAGASGNPYFILETVDLLRDTGALVVQDRRATLAPDVDLGSIVVPGSVQGMVASRLDRLPLEEHLVLKVASVIGRAFPMALLEAIYPVAEHKDRLEEILQSLEWLDLVKATGEGRWYRFTQPVTLELAYNSMLFSQRRQLHRQVAEWYEQQANEDHRCDSQALSDHWLKAGEPMKALHYLEEAGQEALQRGDFAEAERLFKAALELEAQAAVLEERGSQASNP
ncbi:MAG TPA: response regulator [Anaerolineales bacterium]